jgi:hypothetical protein
MSMTMSTSSAPDSTAMAASRALIAETCVPDGKPTTVATLGTPGTARATVTADGDTQTA